MIFDFLLFHVNSKIGAWYKKNENTNLEEVKIYRRSKIVSVIVKSLW